MKFADETQAGPTSRRMALYLIDHREYVKDYLKLRSS